MVFFPVFFCIAFYCNFVKLVIAILLVLVTTASDSKPYVWGFFFFSIGWLNLPLIVI